MKRLSIIAAILMFLFMFAGCQANTDSGAEDQMDWQSLSVDHCGVPVKITATGCEAFEGKTDTVYATDITGDGIIYEVSTCAEFADHFHGTYSIGAKGSRNARYCITPTKPQDYPMEIGMNYYCVILEAKFQTADRVEIQYDSDITVRGLVGDFQLLVLASEKEKWNLGGNINRISGTADSKTDIVLTCTKEGYSLTSAAALRGISITGSKTYNGEYIEITSATEETVKLYTISFADNEYVIKAEG